MTFKKSLERRECRPIAAGWADPAGKENIPAQQNISTDLKSSSRERHLPLNKCVIFIIQLIHDYS